MGKRGDKWARLRGREDGRVKCRVHSIRGSDGGEPAEAKPR